MYKIPGLDVWSTGKSAWAKCLSRKICPQFSSFHCLLEINCSPRPAFSMQIPKSLLPQYVSTSALITIFILTVLVVHLLKMMLFLLEATCCQFCFSPSPLFLHLSTSMCYSPINYCLFYQGQLSPITLPLADLIDLMYLILVIYIFILCNTIIDMSKSRLDDLIQTCSFHERLLMEINVC